MTVKPCAEGDELAQFGADCGGCMTIADYEKVIGQKLIVPRKKGERAECSCYLTCDIGSLWQHKKTTVNFRKTSAEKCWNKQNEGIKDPRIR